MKEFIESEEDELRFTYKKAIKLYGMTLQVQLAADLSKVRFCWVLDLSEYSFDFGNILS